MNRIARLCMLLVLSVPALAQQDMSDVQIKAAQVRAGLYVLTGQGGNIGVAVGADGAFVIDDQYAPLSAKILAAIAAIDPHPVRFVVNTHWHDDHAGGNAGMQAAGAVIVAQENVRKRLATGQFIALLQKQVPPAPPAALPVITFTDTVAFHLNGQDVHVYHVAAAHTDGDSIVHFPGLDAIHMGDTWFAGMYPFIDGSSGGSVDGVIAAADRVLALAGPATRIIPGHGPVGGAAELKAWRTMLATVRDRIRAQLAAGASREAIVAAKPTADFDATYGGGFLKADAWVGMLVDLLSTPAAR